jgi:hypothetical protein
METLYRSKPAIVYIVKEERSLARKTFFHFCFCLRHYLYLCHYALSPETHEGSDQRDISLIVTPIPERTTVRRVEKEILPYETVTGQRKKRCHCFG